MAEMTLIQSLNKKCTELEQKGISEKERVDVLSVDRDELIVFKTTYEPKINTLERDLEKKNNDLWIQIEDVYNTISNNESNSLRVEDLRVAVNMMLPVTSIRRNQPRSGDVEQILPSGAQQSDSRPDLGTKVMDTRKSGIEVLAALCAGYTVYLTCLTVFFTLSIPCKEKIYFLSLMIVCGVGISWMSIVSLYHLSAIGGRNTKLWYPFINCIKNQDVEDEEREGLIGRSGLDSSTKGGFLWQQQLTIGLLTIFSLLYLIFLCIYMFNRCAINHNFEEGRPVLD